MILVQLKIYYVKMYLKLAGNISISTTFSPCNETIPRSCKFGQPAGLNSHAKRSQAQSINCLSDHGELGAKWLGHWGPNSGGICPGPPPLSHLIGTIDVTLRYWNRPSSKSVWVHSSEHLHSHSHSHLHPHIRGARASVTQPLGSYNRGNCIFICISIPIRAVN